MGDSEKKLIRAVKRHTCLYKKDEIGFRDRLKRKRSWKSVAVEFDLPGKYTALLACVFVYIACVLFFCS